VHDGMSIFIGIGSNVVVGTQQLRCSVEYVISCGFDAMAAGDTRVIGP